MDPRYADQIADQVAAAKEPLFPQPPPQLPAATKEASTLSNTLKAMCVMFAVIAVIAIIIALMYDDNSRDAPLLVSGSSRVAITYDYDPDSTGFTAEPRTLVSLRDVHAGFGCANSTCEPSCSAQIIQTAEDDVLGFKETWYKVLLTHEFENSDPDIFSLEDDGHTVSVGEEGIYLVESEIVATAPATFTGFIKICTFVDVNTVGLFDQMRRQLFECKEINYPNAPPSYGPLITIGDTGRMYLEKPSQLILRFLFVTEDSVQIAITASKLQLAKV